VARIAGQTVKPPAIRGDDTHIALPGQLCQIARTRIIARGIKINFADPTRVLAQTACHRMKSVNDS
jgi:hypothetical protein